MHKTLILTDIHMTEEGETLIGLDPMKRFQRVLDHALAHHADVARLVVLGDLTHHGKAAEYARVQSVLDTCPMPVTVTMGNHDTRAALADAFGTHALTDGFAQHAWTEGDTLFVLLDTADEENRAPHHGGWMCDARLRWVTDQIASRSHTRIVAMMHHPPFATGLPGIDKINLSNGQALLDILKAANVPVQLVCGHVHRTITGMAQGCAFTVLKSPCHQMPLNLIDASSGLSVDEPGAYGVLLLTDTEVVVHTQDVFETQNAVTLDPASD